MPQLIQTSEFLSNLIHLQQQQQYSNNNNLIIIYTKKMYGSLPRK